MTINSILIDNVIEGFFIYWMKLMYIFSSAYISDAEAMMAINCTITLFVKSYVYLDTL